jgi:hypothetical protein
MSNLAVTNHARIRSAQRNIPLTDLDIVVMIGSEVENGFYIRDADCEALEQVLRATLKKLTKWRGAQLIVKDGAVVTTYRPTREQEKKMLRSAHDHGL